MSTGKECLGRHLLSRGQARPGLQEQTWAGREQEPDLSAWAGVGGASPGRGGIRSGRRDCSGDSGRQVAARSRGLCRKADATAEATLGDSDPQKQVSFRPGSCEFSGAKLQVPDQALP